MADPDKKDPPAKPDRGGDKRSEEERRVEEAKRGQRFPTPFSSPQQQSPRPEPATDESGRPKKTDSDSDSEDGGEG